MPLHKMAAEAIAHRERALEVDPCSAPEGTECGPRKRLVGDLSGDCVAVRDHREADPVHSDALAALERFVSARADAQPRARVEPLERFDDAAAVNDSGE